MAVSNRLGLVAGTVILVMVTLAAAQETKFSGSTLLQNNVGAYPHEDFFRYNVRVFPPHYDGIAIPRGTYFRVELSVSSPTSRYQYLNISAAEAGLQLIRAYTSAGLVNHCNETAESDVLARVTDLNSADGLDGPNRMSLRGYATFEAPSSAFRICYRKSVSRYTNHTLTHNSTTNWRREVIPPSWRRGSTYKDLWEPMDLTMKFAWQSPTDGAQIRQVNVSQVRFAPVASNATVAGTHGALNFIRSSNFSAAGRMRSSHSLAEADLIKLVPVGTECVSETPYMQYPGTATYGGASVGSLGTTSLSQAAADSEGVVPLGTPRVNWLAGTHTSGDSQLAIASGTAYIKFPDTPGRYHVCYLGFVDREVQEAQTTSTADQCPGWRKAYWSHDASVNWITVEAAPTASAVSWSMESLEHGSWNRLMLAGRGLASGKNTVGDFTNDYLVAPIADSVRLVDEHRFLDPGTGAQAQGCWFRGGESIDDNTGRTGPTAAYWTAGMPSTAGDFPLAPWLAPPNDTRTAAFLRVPRRYQPMRVCFRRRGAVAWETLAETLVPATPTLNATWALDDTRGGTWAAFTVSTHATALSTMPASYASDAAGAVWLRLVGESANCQLDASMLSVRDSSIEAGVADDSAGLRSSVIVEGMLPAVESETTVRVCIRVGSSGWHAAAQPLYISPRVRPAVTFRDTRASGFARIEVSVGEIWNATSATVRLLPNGTHCTAAAASLADAPLFLECNAPSANCTDDDVLQDRVRRWDMDGAWDVSPPQVLVAFVNLAFSEGRVLRACIKSGAPSGNWEPLHPALIVSPQSSVTASFTTSRPLHSGENLTVVLQSSATDMNTSSDATLLRLAPSLSECGESVVDGQLDGMATDLGGTSSSGSSTGEADLTMPTVASPTTFVMCARLAVINSAAEGASWFDMGAVQVIPSPLKFVASSSTLVPYSLATMRITAPTALLSSADSIMLSPSQLTCAAAWSSGTLYAYSSTVQAEPATGASVADWRFEVPSNATGRVRVCYRVSAWNAWVAVPALHARPAHLTSTIDVAAPVVSSWTVDSRLLAIDSPNYFVAGADTGPQYIVLVGSNMDASTDSFKFVTLTLPADAATSRSDSPAGDVQVASSISCEDHSPGAWSTTMAGNSTHISPRAVIPIEADGATYRACYYSSRLGVWVRVPGGDIAVTASWLTFEWNSGSASVNIDATGGTFAGDRLNAICGADCTVFNTVVRFVNTSTPCSLNTDTDVADVTWDGQVADSGTFSVPSPLPLGDFRVCVLRATPSQRESNAVWFAARNRANERGFVTSRPAGTASLAARGSDVAGFARISNHTSRVGLPTPVRITLAYDVDGTLNRDLTVSTQSVHIGLSSNGAAVAAEVRRWDQPNVTNALYEPALATPRVTATPFPLLRGELLVAVVPQAACLAPCNVVVSPLGVSIAIPPTASSGAAVFGAIVVLPSPDSDGFVDGATVASPAIASPNRPLTMRLRLADAAGDLWPVAATIALAFSFDFADISAVACVAGCSDSSTATVTAGTAHISLVFSETRSFVYAARMTTVTMTLVYGGHTQQVKMRVQPAVPRALRIDALSEVASDGTDVPVVGVTLPGNPGGPTAIDAVEQRLHVGVTYRVVLRAVDTSTGADAGGEALRGDSLALVIAPGGSLSHPSNVDGGTLGVVGASGDAYVIYFVITEPCSTAACGITFQSQVFRFTVELTAHVSVRAPTQLRVNTSHLTRCAVNGTAWPVANVTATDDAGRVARASNGTFWVFSRLPSAQLVVVGSNQRHRAVPFTLTGGTGTISGVCLDDACENCTLGLIADSGAVGEVAATATTVNATSMVVQSHPSTTPVMSVPFPLPAEFRGVMDLGGASYPASPTNGRLAPVMSAEARCVTGSASLLCSTGAVLGSPSGSPFTGFENSSSRVLYVNMSATCATCSLSVVVNFTDGVSIESNSLAVSILPTGSATTPTELHMSWASAHEVTAANSIGGGERWMTSRVGERVPVEVRIGSGSRETATTSGAFDVTCAVTVVSGANAPTIFGNGTIATSRFAVADGRASWDVLPITPCLRCRVDCTVDGHSASASFFLSAMPVATTLRSATSIPSTLFAAPGNPLTSSDHWWNLSLYAADSSGYWAHDFFADSCVLSSTSSFVADNSSTSAHFHTSYSIPWVNETLPDLVSRDPGSIAYGAAATVGGVLSGQLQISARCGSLVFAPSAIGIVNVTTSATPVLLVKTCTSAASVPAAAGLSWPRAARMVDGVTAASEAQCVNGTSFVIGETVVLEVQLLNTTHGPASGAWGAVTVVASDDSENAAGHQDVTLVEGGDMRYGRAFPSVRLLSACDGCFLRVSVSPCGSLANCTVATPRFSVRMPSLVLSPTVIIASNDIPATSRTGATHSVDLVLRYVTQSATLMALSDIPPTVRQGLGGVSATVEVRNAANRTSTFEVADGSMQTEVSVQLSVDSPQVPVTLRLTNPCSACQVRLRWVDSAAHQHSAVIASARILGVATRLSALPAVQPVWAGETFGIIVAHETDGGVLADALTDPLAQRTSVVQLPFAGSNNGACGLAADAVSATSALPVPRSGMLVPPSLHLLTWSAAGPACNLSVHTQSSAPSGGAAIPSAWVSQNVSDDVELIDVSLDGASGNGLLNVSLDGATGLATVTLTIRGFDRHRLVVPEFSARADASIVLELIDTPHQAAGFSSALVTPTAITVTPGASNPATLTAAFSLSASAPPTRIAAQVRVAQRSGRHIVLRAETAGRVTVMPASCLTDVLMTPTPVGVAVGNPVVFGLRRSDGSQRRCPIPVRGTLASNCTWSRSNATMFLTDVSGPLGEVSVTFTPPTPPTARRRAVTMQRNVTVENCTIAPQVPGVAPSGNLTALSLSSNGTAGTGNGTARTCYELRNYTVYVLEPISAHPCTFTAALDGSTVVQLTTVVDYARPEELRIVPLPPRVVVNVSSSISVEIVDSRGLRAANLSGTVDVTVTNTTCGGIGIFPSPENRSVTIQRGLGNISFVARGEGACSFAISVNPGSLLVNSTAEVNATFDLTATLPVALQLQPSARPVFLRTGEESRWALHAVDSSGTRVVEVPRVPLQMALAPDFGLGCVWANRSATPQLTEGLADLSITPLVLPERSAGGSCPQAPMTYRSAKAINASAVVFIITNPTNFPVIPPLRMDLRVVPGVARLRATAPAALAAWRVDTPMTFAIDAADALGNSAPLFDPATMLLGVVNEASGSAELGMSLSSNTHPLFATVSSSPQNVSVTFSGLGARLRFRVHWGLMEPVSWVTQFQDFAALVVLESNFAHNMTLGEPLTISVAVVDALGSVVTLDNASVIRAVAGFGIDLVGDPMEKRVVSGVVNFTWFTPSFIAIPATIRFLLADLEVGSPTFSVLQTPAPTVFVYEPRTLALMLGRWPNASSFERAAFYTAIDRLTGLQSATRNDTVVVQVCEVTVPGSNNADRCFANASAAAQWHLANPPVTPVPTTATPTNASNATMPPLFGGVARRLQQASNTSDGADVWFQFQPGVADPVDQLTLADAAILALRYALDDPGHWIHTELQPIGGLRVVRGQALGVLPPAPTTPSPPTPVPPTPTPYPIVDFGSAGGLSCQMCLVAALLALSLALW